MTIRSGKRTRFLDTNVSQDRLSEQQNLSSNDDVGRDRLSENQHSSSVNDVAQDKLSGKQNIASENDVVRDRLSEMPDEVLIHILSLMPTVYAVRTVLLRRFGNLWTLVHTLRFSLYEKCRRVFIRRGDFYAVERFHLFIRKVLKLHKRPSLNKFYLHLDSDDYLSDEDIDAIAPIKVGLRFALNRQAKEIDLCPMYDEWSRNLVLPNLTSQFLVTLALSYCSIDTQTQVNLPSLKMLFLNRLYMSEEAFQILLSGCPNLQELDFKDSVCIDKLSFSSPNVEKLSLALEYGYERDKPWLLNFPNVKSLILEINRIPVMIGASSVRDVYFKAFAYAMDDENERIMCEIFLGKFEGAEVFQLSLQASEPFLHSIVDLQLLQFRWKRVVVALQVFCESCLFGIYQMMENLTHLEELVIYTAEHTNHRARSSFRQLERSSPCVMPKLKTITLHGYVKPWNRQLQLVEFLLKSAVVLDKLFIVSNKHRLTTAEELEFIKRVSSFQKASPSAWVVFA